MTHPKLSSKLWARTRAQLWLLAQGSFPASHCLLGRGWGWRTGAVALCFVQVSSAEKNSANMAGRSPYFGGSHRNDRSRRERPCRPGDPSSLAALSVP